METLPHTELDSAIGSGDQPNNAEGVRERDASLGLSSVRRIIAGEPLELEVDLKRGY